MLKWYLAIKLAWEFISFSEYDNLLDRDKSIQMPWKEIVPIKNEDFILKIYFEPQPIATSI